MVLVHGSLDGSDRFDRVVPLLANECQLLRYDRRGYGRSLVEGPPPALDVEGHIDDLLALLDRRQAAVLAAHSFGGLVALGAAARVPSCTRAIVLYETALPWLPSWPKAVVQAALDSDDPDTEMLELMLGGRLTKGRPAWQAARRAEGPALVAEQRSVRQGRATFDPTAVTVPVIYGHGTLGPHGQLIDDLVGALPPVELTVVDGAGHNAPSTHPEAFAAMIRHGLDLARASS